MVFKGYINNTFEQDTITHNTSPLKKKKKKGENNTQ